MNRQDKVVPQLYTKPPPPPSLGKEKIALWNKWCDSTDSAVIREAATKGIYIDLALTFLSLRGKLTPEQSKELFDKEVVAWTNELLKQKSIHKLTHVLNNCGFDPAVKILKEFFDATDLELREYLGAHLLSINKLGEDVVNSWALLKAIRGNDIYKTSNPEILPFNLNNIHNKSIEWKTKMSCDLFVKCFDVGLEPFLDKVTLWETLLQSNNTKMLLLWINIQFLDPNYELDNKAVPPIMQERLRTLFKQYIITTDMIDKIDEIEDTNPIRQKTREIVLNEFSKFGIFSKKEFEVPSILGRFRNTKNLENICTILNSSSLSFKFEDFQQMLLNYCLDKKYYSLLNYFLWTKTFLSDQMVTETSDEGIKLILNIKELSKNFNNSEALINNLLNVGRYLSNGNLKQHFKHNPIILIGVLILMNVQDYKGDVGINITLDEEIITSIGSAMPFVKSVLTKLDSNNTEVLFNYYNVLEQQFKINCDDIFYFKSDRMSLLPHFTSTELVKKYGYSKILNYTFYLKQSRPSIASEHFIVNHVQSFGNIDMNQETRQKVLNKVFRLAIKNFTELDIVTSCIAFLEMIGLSSDSIRVHVKMANIISSSNLYHEDEVKLLVLNASKNPEKVANAAEKSLFDNFDITMNCAEEDVIKIFRLFMVLVKFCKIHDIKLPELFLKICAEKSMWVLFLVFIEVFNYPLDQSRRLAEYFENSPFGEHFSQSLLIALPQKENFDEDRVMDLRRNYLQKLGLQRKEGAMTRSLTSYRSVEIAEDKIEDNFVPNKTNILMVLMKAHKSADPPKALLQASLTYKNSVLALLATSYEPDSYLTYWLTWLVVGCELEDEYSNVESLITSPSSVSKILLICLQKKYCKTLLQSFKIFLKEHPLLAFLEFLIDCINLNFNGDTSIEKLKIFEGKIKNMASNAIIAEEDFEMRYINNRSWVENVAIGFIGNILQYNINNRHIQIKFLKFMNFVQLETYLPRSSFTKKILNLLEALGDCDHLCDHMNLSYLFHTSHHNDEVSSSIDRLINLGLYSTALDVAKYCEVKPDLILIKEWEQNYSVEFKNINNFWQTCDSEFRKHGMTPASAVHFYLKMLNKSLKTVTRYEILQLMQKWAKDYNLPELCKIERCMWSLFISLREKNRECGRPIDEVTTLMYCEMQAKLDKMYKNLHGSDLECFVNVSFSELEKVVEELFQDGDVWQILKLEKLFSYLHPDMDVVKICFQLAEGTILPHQLTPGQRLILMRGKQNEDKATSTEDSSRSRQSLPKLSLSFRRTLSNRSQLSFTDIASIAESLSSSTLCIYEDEQQLSPIMETLERFYGCLNHGQQIGMKILATFRITANSQVPYKKIVTCKEPFDLLKNILHNPCTHKLDVVTDFMWIFKWKKEEVSDFICHELMEAISKYATSNNDTIYLWDLELDKHFQYIHQVIPDNCSTLGYKLFSFATSMFKIQSTLPEVDKKVNYISVVEALIRSHDCFSSDCNMEGITMVLKQCHVLVPVLQTNNNYILLVRLLTGVGRYTEMGYVFKILQTNAQFELLLTRKLKTDSALKFALLDYISKNCIDNVELHEMVALYFNLYSEVATLWEKQAQKIMENLAAVARVEMQQNNIDPDTSEFLYLMGTDENKILAQKAMNFYVQASEYYIEAEQLNKAMNAANQAQLLAFQTYLLTNTEAGKYILNLSNNQFLKLSTTEFMCKQVLIVSEAYNYTVDWGVVLYEQYVVANNVSFFADYLCCSPLSDSLITDISRHYSRASNSNDISRSNMCKVIRKANSVHTKYTIANELGFMDVIEELLERNQLSYIKDTIWRQRHGGESN